MKLESINIEYTGQIIFTDFDDTIVHSNKVIIKSGFLPRKFWFDSESYNKHHQYIFDSACLTDFGVELYSLIKSGKINPEKVIVVSAAKGREDIINKKTLVPNENIITSCSKYDRIVLLEELAKQHNVIYIDDLQHNILLAQDIPCQKIWYNSYQHRKKYDSASYRRSNY